MRMRTTAWVRLAMTVAMFAWAGSARAQASRVAFASDQDLITATSVALQSALSVDMTLDQPGFVVVTTGADDDVTGAAASGDFCEISIGVAPGATPSAFAEVFAARKTYQSRNTLLSNTYVVGPLERGDYVLHFLFKSNLTTSTTLLDRQIYSGN